MEITGNTILITGGASGIGLALAESFYIEKNTVIIVGRNDQKLAEAKIKYPGLNTIQADITNEQDRQHLLNETREHFPQLNMLVNNAGAAFLNDLRTDPDFYQKTYQEIETNFLAPVRLTQLFLETLQKHPSAAVINITTIGVFLPLTVMPGYSASKAALSSFTRSLRFQLENTPVKVFEVLPPPVDTALVSMFHMHKISPEKLAEKVMHGLKKDRYEMSIGIAKVLRWMGRLAPHTAEAMSHKQSLKTTRRS